MNRFRHAWLTLLGAAWLVLSVVSCGGAEDRLLLGATTSLDDTGILQELIEAFEDESGYDVTPVIAGTAQVLELGRRGEVDVMLTHSPRDEAAFVAEGYGLESKPVMENSFVVVGPEDDPAGVRGAGDAVDALARIAAARELFVSRGDRSGTNQREMAIWQEAGIDPEGESWYQESAVGQGQSLLFANERQAYTLVDSATFAVFDDEVDLVRFTVGTEPNVYSVTLVDPKLDDEVNAEAARVFFDYVTSDGAREVIATYVPEGGDEPLFVPASVGQ